MAYSALRDNAYSKYNSLLDQTKGMETSGPASLSYNMRKGVPGSYDDLRLYPTGGSTWRKPPSDVPLQQGKFFVVQGSGVPLRSESVPVALPKNSMFVFAQNVASPACCPATHSTSTGCVCTTPQQRDLIGVYRGNNHNYPTSPPI